MVAKHNLSRRVVSVNRSDRLCTNDSVSNAPTILMLVSLMPVQRDCDHVPDRKCAANHKVVEQESDWFDRKTDRLGSAVAGKQPAATVISELSGTNLDCLHAGSATVFTVCVRANSQASSQPIAHHGFVS